jgi:hypothetical protein
MTLEEFYDAFRGKAKGFRVVGKGLRKIRGEDSQLQMECPISALEDLPCNFVHTVARMVGIKPYDALGIIYAADGHTYTPEVNSIRERLLRIISEENTSSPLKERSLF